MKLRNLIAIGKCLDCYIENTNRLSKNKRMKNTEKRKNTCSVPEAKVDSASIHNNISTEVVKHSRYIILHK